MTRPSMVKDRRSEKLDLRISRAAKAKLQAAAAAAHRSMSDFVVESAISKADEALAERRSFSLDAKRWAAFQAALDAPARPLPRLRKLLTETAFFDTGTKR